MFRLADLPRRSGCVGCNVGRTRDGTGGGGGLPASVSEYWLASVETAGDAKGAGAGSGGTTGGSTGPCLPPTAPMETAALRGNPRPSCGTVTGIPTEESRWTTAAGNSGSSTDAVELRDKYMLISEPTPSPPATELRGECRVTSRNGALDGETLDFVGDPEARFCSRETRERLPRGEGVKPVESELSWGFKPDVERFNGAICGCL